MRSAFLTLAFLSPSLGAVVQMAHHATAPHSTITIPLAKRFPADVAGSMDTVPLITQRARMYRKLEQGFAAYERNMGVAHPDDIRRYHDGASDQLPANHYYKRLTGANTLIDDSDTLWYGNITVGTPPVSYRVDFDTGSADLFLPGTSCQTCQGHRIYNTNASSTSRPLGRNFSLSYGDGSTVEGYQFTDTVTISGLTAVNQTLGAATRYSQGFNIQTFSPDGLMGMSYPQISEYGANPVFNTLITQNQTTAPQFGFKLATNGSELFLGGFNARLFNGSLTWSPVTKQGFWQINLESVKMNGSSVARGLSTIVDAGTSLVYGDTHSVIALYNAISGSKNASRTVGDGFFTVPCNAVPTVSLTFNGTPFAIAPDSFNLGPVTRNSSDCVGGIVAASLPFWVAGDVFLRNIYTAFDFGNNTVGFATLV